MSHSRKNNTRAFFTAHERAELKGQWGSNSTRLTRESFLPFGSCNLCLIQAQDPVACPDEGHLFCRECVVSNLLAQVKEIKRLHKAQKRRAAEDAEEKELKSAEAQTEELNMFEKVQAGIDVPALMKRARSDEGNDQQSKKRKTEDGQEIKRDTSFWIPSQNGEDKRELTIVSKKHSTCPVALTKQPHDLSLKNLIDVKFRRQDDKDSREKPYVCPSCNKLLSNSTKAILAKSCGHVLCKACNDKFQTIDGSQQNAACFTCATPISVLDAAVGVKTGSIMLKTHATGFAGAGNNTVKKEGVAFQFG